MDSGIVEKCNRVMINKTTDGNYQFSLSDIKSASPKHLIYDCSFEDLQNMHALLGKFLAGGYSSVNVAVDLEKTEEYK